MPVSKKRSKVSVKSTKSKQGKKSKLQNGRLHGVPFDVSSPMLPYSNSSVVKGYVRLSPEKAAELLELPLLVPERKLNIPHYLHMRWDSQHGRFNWDLVDLVFIKLNGKLMRGNGNHTLRYIASMPAGKFIPTVRTLTYKVSNMSEAVRIWCDLDKGKQRTKAQFMAMMLGQEDGYKECPELIAPLYKGLNAYLGESKNELSIRELFTLLAPGGIFYPTAMMVKKVILANIRKRWCKSASVVGAIIGTMYKYPRKYEYWMKVFSDPTLRSGTPAYELREWLKRIRIITSKKNNSRNKWMTKEEALRFCMWGYVYGTRGKRVSESLLDVLSAKSRPKGFEVPAI